MRCVNFQPSTNVIARIKYGFIKNMWYKVEETWIFSAIYLKSSVKKGDFSWPLIKTKQLG